MRRVLPLFMLMLLLAGCKGDYDWRTEHRGVLKTVNGYDKMMVVTFEDGAAYKVPAAYLTESDQWGMGQEVILQTEKVGGGSVYWRFRSITILEPGDPMALPAEKTPGGK